jgi:hypothetical protein
MTLYAVFDAERDRNQFPSVLLQRSHICPRQCLRAQRLGGATVAAQLKSANWHGTQRFRRPLHNGTSNNRRFD